MFFLFHYISDQYKTQEIYNLAVSSYPFVIVCCPDKYITQKMCDEAIDHFLAALKLIADWFVTSKMIKKLYTALYADENIFYCNKNFLVIKWVFLV